MVADDVDRAGEKRDRRHDVGADRRVAAHDIPFSIIEGASLGEDALGDADLPDVVQEEAVRELRTRGELGIHPPRQCHPVGGGPIEMAPRALVLRLDDPRGGHGRDVGLLKVRERPFEVAAALTLQVVQLAELPGEDDELSVDGGKLGVFTGRSASEAGGGFQQVQGAFVSPAEPGSRRIPE